MKNLKIGNIINYFLLIALLVAGISMFSAGMLHASIAQLFTQVAFSIILAVSLNLVVGFLGELSLGHAGFMCVGAYIGGYLANELITVIPNKLIVLVISMLVGGLISAVFGFIIGLPSLRLKGDYLAIVTLAFGEIVRNIFKNIKLFGGARGLNTNAIHYDTRQEPFLFAVAIIVAILMLFFVQNFINSKHGRAVTAIRDNEIAAKSMGINVAFYKLFVFAVATFFAGVAGVIYSHYASPVLYGFFSYNYSIEILVMVVLGGMGNITGSIISAILIPTVNYFLLKYVPSDIAPIRLLAYAVILIVIIIFTNAPAIKKFREKHGLVFKRKSSDPSRRIGDSAKWHRIPTKIKMDAILSTDLKPDSPESIHGDISALQEERGEKK